MLLTTPKELGALVRQRRRDLGLTQAAVAERAGVRRLWIHSLEHGKSTVELGLVLRVLKALELSLDVVPNVRTASELELPDLAEIIERSKRPR
ncbi:MAG: helix-turn-helix domain-containing protein [Polyangiaceae bacterium]